MPSTWFSSVFLSFLKIQVKEGRPNFLGRTNPAERLNYFVPLLYFNFRSLKDPNSLPFIIFKCLLDCSAAPFSAFWKLIKLKTGDVSSSGEAILQNSWITSSPLLYFNFRSLKNPNCLSFIRFQWILHDSAVLFSAFWKLVKLKRGDLISSGEPILQKGCIIWSPLLYFNFRSVKDPNFLSFFRF